MMGRQPFLLLLVAIATVLSVATASSSYVATTSLARRSHVAELETQRVTPKRVPNLSRGGASIAANQKEILGAGFFLAMNEAVRRAFQANKISFPAQLGGCIILFVLLLLSEGIRPGLGEHYFQLLSPGAALLAKWLPVFFVPGLVMLPRAPSVGTGIDVFKILSLVGIGFLYSLITTASSVMTLRKYQGTFVSAPASVTNVASPAKPTVKPYSEQTLGFLLKGSALFAAISIAATRTNHEFKTPIQTLFFGFASVAAYVWSARLPANFTKVVHPLVTCTALILSFIKLFGLATESSFMNVLATYKAGSLNWRTTGAGDILLHLLGPAVVSFAVSMYSRKKLLKENLSVVITAMLVSSLGGLFGTASFVRLIKLGGSTGRLVRLSVIPRNVTTALAMAIATILGGDISIAASVVVLTGILGATFGRTLLDAMGITDPITRGLAVGSSGQGLGVASMVHEPDAFPFAAIAMVLTAVCSTSLVSIPAVKDVIVNIATA